MSLFLLFLLFFSCASKLIFSKKGKWHYDGNGEISNGDTLTISIKSSSNTSLFQGGDKENRPNRDSGCILRMNASFGFSPISSHKEPYILPCIIQ